MYLLGRLFNKLTQIYIKSGMRSLANYIGWMVKTFIEKALIRFEDRWHLFSYDNWIKDYEKTIHREKTEFINRPRISVTFLIDIRNFTENDLEKLEFTVVSLKKQNIPDWECFLIIEAGFDINTINLRNDLITEDRIKIHTANMKSGRNADIISILPILKSKWVIWTKIGDAFSENLLVSLQSINSEIVYWDEDIIKNGQRCDPFFKPDWSPELWLSVDLLFCSAIRVDFLRSVSQKKVQNSIIAKCVAQAEHIDHISEILSHCRARAWMDQKDINEHEFNIKEYLALSGISGAGIQQRSDGSLRVSWPVRHGKVSIIILNKDNYSILRQCIQSIIQKTTYGNYEIIIVDDDSTQESVTNYYHTLHDVEISLKVVQGNKPFNYSQACNIGARFADGEYLLFLNNDTEVISSSWLDELILFASIMKIGIVGGKLLYPDHTIQHAGIIMGLEGHASHIFLGSFEGDPSMYGSINWYRNYSAVTGACMMMRKQVFDEAGGFDENYKLVFSDIDICLRTIRAGYRVMYNPEVRLYHYEGKSRGKFIPSQDIQLGYDRFVEYISHGDPYYNKALSLSWRIPTLKRSWEQSPVERLQKITFYS